MDTPLDERLLDAWEILTDIRHVGARAWADGDTLRVRPRTALTPEIGAAIREHKPALLQILRRAARLAEEQSCEILQRRLEAGTDLLFSAETAGRPNPDQYLRDLNGYIPLLCAYDLASDREASIGRSHSRPTARQRPTTSRRPPQAQSHQPNKQPGTAAHAR